MGMNWGKIKWLWQVHRKLEAQYCIKKQKTNKKCSVSTLVLNSGSQAIREYKKYCHYWEINNSFLGEDAHAYTSKMMVSHERQAWIWQVICHDILSIFEYLGMNQCFRGC